jgi:demethylmenaquinone methyltransferase/2-methoxy-6-polyprenyl-1,4-benzoquinol methylase
VLEEAQVRAMFDRISGLYDRMNSVMTAGLHHQWRRRAADLAALAPGGRALDVATGTGDLAIELAQRVSPGGEVVGSDFSEAMLDRARAKALARFGPHSSQPAGGYDSPDGGGQPNAAARRGEGPATANTAASVKLRFEWGDALELPYPDNCFDAATVAFGARNFADLRRGLVEMARVVKPGGRVVVLDFTTPTRPPLSLFYRVWFDRIVPLLGRLTAPLGALLPTPGEKDPAEVTIADAYAYLPSSVKRFSSPPQLAAEMEAAGMTGVRYILTAGGIVVIHAATVPM